MDWLEAAKLTDLGHCETVLNFNNQCDRYQFLTSHFRNMAVTEMSTKCYSD